MSVIEEAPAGPRRWAMTATTAACRMCASRSSAPASPGLGLAIRLKEQGIEDFVLIERADDVGGTWQANTYPGCQCDVPSHLYSFSFAPNPDWTRTYSRQPEIWKYLRDVAASHGLHPHIRFGHELTGAAWDDERGRWNVETSRGAWTAQLLVDATGPLSYPAMPRIRGMGSFKGTMFHSAEWDHDHDLTGERVAVIGTGASAIQFVPQIADQRRPDARLPAHGAVDPAALRPADDALRAAPVPARCRSCRRPCAAASTGAARASCWASSRTRTS